MASKETITKAQRKQFEEWGADPPPTSAAAQATMDYIVRGYPRDGKLTQAERIERYRTACKEWTGATIVYEPVPGMQAEGKVEYIKGWGVKTTLMGASASGPNPFIAVIRPLDGSPVVQRNLHFIFRKSE